MKVLHSRTDANGEEGFVDAVRAFIDVPGVAMALGFPEGTTAVDVQTSASLLRNIEEMVSSLHSKGSRNTEQMLYHSHSRCMFSR